MSAIELPAKLIKDHATEPVVFNKEYSWLYHAIHAKSPEGALVGGGGRPPPAIMCYLY
jgi:hypothetical protein